MPGLGSQAVARWLLARWARRLLDEAGRAVCHPAYIPSSGCHG